MFNLGKSLKRVSLWNIIWFLIYLIPFIGWLILAIANNGNALTNRFSMADIYIGFQYVFDLNNIFINWLVDIYRLISQNSNFIIGSNIESVLIISCYWLIFVTLMRLIVEIVLVLPRVCFDFLHKFNKGENKDL